MASSSVESWGHRGVHTYRWRFRAVALYQSNRHQAFGGLKGGRRPRRCGMVIFVAGSIVPSFFPCCFCHLRSSGGREEACCVCVQVPLRAHMSICLFLLFLFILPEYLPAGHRVHRIMTRGPPAEQKWAPGREPEGTEGGARSR